MRAFWKQVNKSYKILLISLLAVLISLAYFTEAAEASLKNTDAFMIEVGTKLGADDVPFQVVLNFSSIKEDFLGDVFLSVPYDGTDYVLLSKDLQLEKGRDQSVFLPTGLAENSGLLRLEIKDRQGKLVFRHDIILTEEESKLAWKLQKNKKEYKWYNENFFERSTGREKKPVLFLYFAVLFVYIFIILPGLFFVLKKKDKMNYLRELIAAFSIAFCGIIFVMGAGTRLTAPSLKYVRVISCSEEQKNDNILFSVQMPYSQQIQLNYDKSFNAEGLFINEHHEKGSNVLYNHYRYSIFDGINESFISMETSVAVTPVYFKLRSETKLKEDEGVKGKVTVGNDTVSGSLTAENMSCDEIALLYGGKVVRLNSEKNKWDLNERRFLSISALESDALRRFAEKIDSDESMYLIGIKVSSQAEFISGAEEFEVSGMNIYLKKVDAYKE